MALIRASCPECGDVELGSNQIQGQIWDGRESYIFRCPVCRMTIPKDCDAQVIQILGAAGCKIVSIEPPKWETLETSVDLTVDEIIDFHEMLKDDEAIFAELDL